MDWKPIKSGYGTPPNFVEKTFADGSQTSKTVKVFSLYGTLQYRAIMIIVSIILCLHVQH